MPEPKMPDVHVKLLGINGNAFSVLGAVSRAMRDHGSSQDTIDEYQKEAMSGDYDNLLAVTMSWVTVE